MGHIFRLQVFLVALVVACGGQDDPDLEDPDANGQMGILTFRAIPRDMEHQAGLATSALVDVEIIGPEGCTGGCGDEAQCYDRPAEILEARSSDPNVFEVVDVQPRETGETVYPSIQLRGTGAGRANLEVRARLSGGGYEVEDAFEIEVGEVEEFEFCLPFCSYRRQDPDNFVFLSNQKLELDYAYHGADGFLGGYGFYPLEVEPAGAATVEQESPVLTVLARGINGSNQQVTLRSMLGHHSLTMQFVDESEINALEVELAQGNAGPLDDGQTAEIDGRTYLTLVVRPFRAGVEVFTPEIDLRLRTTPESICRFPAGQGRVDSVEDLPIELTTALLQRPRVITFGLGSCPITVDHLLPDGTTGATATVEFVLVDGHE